jgi:fatty-acyl-CoA synthase
MFMSDFVNKTIGQVIQEAAISYPENPALIQPEFKLRQNYRDFYASCRETAKGLMALGVKRGDKISVWTTNIPQWVYLQFSLGMIGGILVTVNTNYSLMNWNTFWSSPIPQLCFLWISTGT